MVRAGVIGIYTITTFAIWNGSTIYDGRGNTRDGFLTKRQESHPIRRRPFSEIVLKAYCIPVMTRLSQYTDQRVPDGTTMPRFAAADVDRILAGRSGSFYIPYELANQKAVF